jgi:GNAT superfamily N-acetyltransferase
MHIRQFEYGDEEQIANIHNAAFKNWIETLGSQYYYRNITSQDVLHWLNANGIEGLSLWVVEESNNLIGYAHCYLQIEETQRKVPVMYFAKTHWDMGQSKVAVLPDYQRKSVGTSLIESAIEYYKSFKAEVVMAFSYNDNYPMEALLTKLGFSHPGVFYYPPYSEKESLGHDSVYAYYDLTSPLPDIPLNSAVNIRPAEERDADDLFKLFQKNAFWIEEEVTHDWISEYFSLIQNENGRILIAEFNDKLVGAMDYMSVNGRIGIPGVLPEYRRQGIGYTLFFHLLRTMQNDGLKSAIADTGIILPDPIRMYHQFGFDIQRKQHLWVKLLQSNG